MSIAIITGSGGLIGTESVKFFSKKFDRIVGIDNDSRQYFFGKLASRQFFKSLKIILFFNLNSIKFQA